MRKLNLLAVFYRSTLSLSASVALTIAVFGGVVHFLTFFGVALMTGGTVISLFYKEITSAHEYVFFNNLGLSKGHLWAFCVLANAGAGLLLIMLSNA